MHDLGIARLAKGTKAHMRIRSYAEVPTLAEKFREGEDPITQVPLC